MWTALSERIGVELRRPRWPMIP